jgi:hypothetical protein
MTSRTDRSIWYDVGWPLLAGLVGAAGVIMTYVGIGLLGTVVAFVLVELTVTSTAWSVMTELARSGRPAIFELAPTCALATVVTLGLVTGLQAWALPVLVLVIVTSPLLERRRPGGQVRRYGSDWDDVHREFDAIVAHAFGPDRTDG